METCTYSTCAFAVCVIVPAESKQNACMYLTAQCLCKVVQSLVYAFLHIRLDCNFFSVLQFKQDFVPFK